MTDTIETMPQKRHRELRAMNTGSNRLPIIEAQIKIEHDACLSAVRTSIEHAIKAGALLEEAKGLLKHGQWLPWLSDHCGLSDRIAQRYMRLARNAKSATMADLGIAAADRLLGLLAEWDNDEQHDAHVRNWLEHRFGPWHDDDQQEKERGDDTGDDKDAELFASLRDKADKANDEDTHPLSCGGDVAARAYFAREAAHDAGRVIARAKKEERKAAADARGDTGDDKARGDDTGDKAAAHKPEPGQHDAHVANWLKRYDDSWSYYPANQFANMHRGLNLLVNQLREVTHLATIRTNDRTEAIEDLEGVIVKARACIDALETNDKKHLDAAIEQEEIERKRRIGNTN